MIIETRYICGDNTLWNQFENFKMNNIYFDHQDGLRKLASSNYLLRKDILRNIKKGVGFRAIHNLCWALCGLYDIREIQINKILQKAAQKNIITNKECISLIKAYDFTLMIRNDIHYSNMFEYDILLDYYERRLSIGEIEKNRLEAIKELKKRSKLYTEEYYMHFNILEKSFEEIKEDLTTIIKRVRENINSEGTTKKSLVKNEEQLIEEEGEKQSNFSQEGREAIVHSKLLGAKLNWWEQIDPMNRGHINPMDIAIRLEKDKHGGENHSPEAIFDRVREKREKIENKQYLSLNSGTDTSVPTLKEFETIFHRDGKRLSEEGKKVNSIVYDALYSDDQRRQKAINKLKQIKDKKLIRETYKKHRQYSWGKSWPYECEDNFAQVRKLIGINPTVKSDVLDERGRLKEEINVGTVDDLPDASIDKRREILNELSEKDKFGGVFDRDKRISQKDDLTLRLASLLFKHLRHGAKRDVDRIGGSIAASIEEVLEFCDNPRNLHSPEKIVASLSKKRALVMENQKDIQSVSELKNRLSDLRNLFMGFKDLYETFYSLMEKKLEQFPVNKEKILIRSFAQAKWTDANMRKSKIKWMDELEEKYNIPAYDISILSSSLFIGMRFCEEALGILSGEKKEIKDLKSFLEKEVIPPFNQNGYNVRYNFSLPDKIKGFYLNPYALSLAVEKIISNALWHTFYAIGEDEKILIDIDILAEVQDNSIAIKIRDYGSGIEKERLEIGKYGYAKLFESGIGDRTGIGMTLTHALVESIGGEIFAENIKDRKRGAMFTIEIPLSASNTGVVQRKFSIHERKIVDGNLEIKPVDSFVHDALYSTGQKRQNAIKELKESENKSLIRYNLKKHGNEIRNRKLFGKYGGAINYIENKLGLNKLDNVGTADDLPDAISESMQQAKEEIQKTEQTITDCKDLMEEIKNLE